MDELAVAGVTITHPDRVLYPEQGITKRELARYFERVADRLLPELAGRPLTLVRCPQGREKKCFYQRNLDGLRGVELRFVEDRDPGNNHAYASVESLAGVVGLVQWGVLELHTWGSRQPDLGRPDRVTFDLDPGPGTGWRELRAAALDVRSKLEALGLGAFVKTTGGKGLHVVTPIAATQDWPFVADFARALAESLVADQPARYIATASKVRRRGKIFIDHLRNAAAASTVSAYSPRAREGAPVSMPLDWSELGRDPRRNFTMRSVSERAASRRAPWREYEAARAALDPELMGKL